MNAGVGVKVSSSPLPKTDPTGTIIYKKWGGACKRANLHKKDQGNGTG